MINNNLGNSIFFNLNNYACPLFIIAFIIYIRNAFYYFIVYEMADLLRKEIAVHLEWYFSNYNFFFAVLRCFNRNASPKHDPATTGVHGCLNAFVAVNNSTGWKIGSFNELDQLINGNFFIVNICNASIH